MGYSDGVARLIYHPWEFLVELIKSCFQRHEIIMTDLAVLI